MGGRIDRSPSKGRRMRFLLRLAFWLGVVAVLLPRDGTEPPLSAQVSALDAMSAATATVGDLRQFCERQPEACNVGSQAAVALEDRAKAGAKRLYDMFNERLAANESDRAITVDAPASPAKSAKPIPLPTPRPTQRGSMPALQNAARNVSPGAAPAASHNTLTPADRAPAWQRPQSPRRDAAAQPA
jgi:hypothetical protein